MRERHIPDTRVHVVLFFINPSGHSLRQIDIQVLKKLGDIANVIPVIAKADTLTLEERDLFKQRVRAELQNNNIRVYPFDHEDYDEEERELSKWAPGGPDVGMEAGKSASRTQRVKRTNATFTGGDAYLEAFKDCS